MGEALRAAGVGTMRFFSHPPEWLVWTVWILLAVAAVWAEYELSVQISQEGYRRAIQAERSK